MHIQLALHECESAIEGGESIPRRGMSTSCSLYLSILRTVKWNLKRSAGLTCPCEDEISNLERDFTFIHGSFLGLVVQDLGK